MKTLHKIGVVGAGTMGSALAQKFAQEGFRVILADREMEYVEKGITGITTTLNEGVEKGVFKEDQVKGIISRLQGTASAILPRVSAGNPLLSLFQVAPPSVDLMMPPRRVAA